MSDASAARRFVPFAWGTLGYTLLVILFGAWVRITGSGAGCGQHWPTCHGEVIHFPQSVETLIELTHRVTSGIDGILALALMVWARRAFPRGHLARHGAVLALVFVGVEALLGAALVRWELVAEDDSVARAVVMSIHLVNTSFLTGAMALAAWASTHPESPARIHSAGLGKWLAAGIVGLLLVSMSGAVTALGDTLYPAEAQSLAGRIGEDYGPLSHFLQRVRIFHPVLAVVVALYLVHMVTTVVDRCGGDDLRPWAKATLVLVLIQIGAGVVNIFLSAPGWMQIVHLGLAKLLWIAVVLLAANALTRRGEHRR